MTKDTKPRLILTKGSLSWLVEHPDNEWLNRGLLQAYGEITPLPIPYTRHADFETVRAGMRLSFPNHDIIRGEDIQFPIQYLEVLS